MKNENEKNRISFVDLAKGICIILVVFEHASTNYEILPELSNSLACIRMPLYFMLSGMFFKVYTGFASFTKRKVNKLLCPYLFWFLISAIITPFIVVNIANYKSDLFFYRVDFKCLFYFFTEKLYFNNPIWFLLCLFELNIVYYTLYIIRQKGNLGKYFLLYGSFLIGLLGYTSGTYFHINIPMYIDTAMTAMPFFCIGWLLRNHTMLLYPNKYDKFNWLFVCIGIVIVVFIACPVTYLRNQYRPHSLLNIYISGIVGALIIMLIAKQIEKIPLVSYIGKYSIIVLVTHMFVLPVWQKLILNFFHSQSLIGLFFVMVGTIVSMLLVIPFCKRFVPFAVAQKDIIKI